MSDDVTTPFLQSYGDDEVLADESIKDSFANANKVRPTSLFKSTLLSPANRTKSPPSQKLSSREGSSFGIDVADSYGQNDEECSHDDYSDHECNPLMDKKLRNSVFKIDFGQENYKVDEENDDESKKYREMVKYIFKKFIVERNKVKRDLYYYAAVSGAIIALLSFLLYGVVYSYYEAGQCDQLTFDVIAVLSTFMRVAGIVLYSIVPQNDFDIMDIFGDKVHHPFLHTLIFLGMGCAIQLYSAYSLYTTVGANNLTLSGNPVEFLTYVLIFGPSIVFGFFPYYEWFRRYHREQHVHEGGESSSVSRNPHCSVDTITSGTTSVSVSVSENSREEHFEDYYRTSLMFKLVFMVSIIINVLFYWIILNGFADTNVQVAELYGDISIVDHILIGGIDASVWLVAISYEFYSIYKLRENLNKLRNEDNPDGYRGYGSQSVFYTTYRFCSAFGISCFLIGLSLQIKGSSLFFIQYLIGLADSIPLVAVFWIGEKKCFTLLAAMFEHDSNRLQADGAFMAVLIDLCKTVWLNEDEKVFWIRRIIKPGSQDRKQLVHRNSCGFPHYPIDRNLWMKGTVSIEPNASLTISFSHQDDKDENTLYLFCKQDMKTVKLISNMEGRTEDGDVWTRKKSDEGRKILPSAFTGDEEDWFNSFDSAEYPELKQFAFQKDAKISFQIDSSNDFKFGRGLVDFVQKQRLQELSTPLKSDKDRDRFVEWESKLKLLKARVSFRYAIVTEEEEFGKSQLKLTSNKGSNETKKSLEKAIYAEFQTVQKRIDMFQYAHPLLHITNSSEKVDFFISHSWADTEPRNKDEMKFTGDTKQKQKKKKSKSGFKIKALIHLIIGFKRKNSQNPPKIWLDKVCIDQRNPTDGISALPITLSTCREVVILMGTTYLKKLWCIWELVNVFIFSNKELAYDRIRVYVSFETLNAEKIEQEDGGTSGATKSKEQRQFEMLLEEFNLNKAYAFDPNEEAKLRYIFYKIVGEKTVTAHVREMSKLWDLGRVYYQLASDGEWQQSKGSTNWLDFLTI